MSPTFRENQTMPLAARALVPVPSVPGMARVTCHFATWFWAAQEAQQSGQTPIKTAAVTIVARAVALNL